MVDGSKLNASRAGDVGGRSGAKESEKHFGGGNRIFYGAAGVDAETANSCPPADRVWLAHIGKFLIATFILQFLLVTAAMQTALGNFAISVVTGIVVSGMLFLFDRAIIQADFYNQGEHELRRAQKSILNGMPITLSLDTAFKRLGFAVPRLAVVFGYAWFVAYTGAGAFLHNEIEDERRQMQLELDPDAVEKINQFRTAGEQKIAELQVRLDKTDAQIFDANARLADTSPQSDEVASALRNEIGQLDKKLEDAHERINDAEDRIVRERNGQVPDGRAGTGPRWEVAVSDRDIALKDIQRLDAERFQKSEELRAHLDSRTKPLEDALERAEQTVTYLTTIVRPTLKRELDTAISLQEQRVEDYEKSIFSSSATQTVSTGFATNVRAIERLKSKPETGAAVASLLFAIKFFVITLESAALGVKILCPPKSVYALRLFQSHRQEANAAYLEELDSETEKVQRERKAKNNRNEMRQDDLFNDRLRQATKKSWQGKPPFNWNHKFTSNGEARNDHKNY